MSQVRAVVLDCFGVLYGGTLGVLRDLAPNDEARKAISDLAKALDHGFVSYETFSTEVSSLVGVPADEIRQIASQPTVRHRGMFAYASELKERGYMVAVLSNFGRDAISRLFTKQEREELFSVIIASGDIGATKPHLKAYETVLEELRVQPHEAVMVDDWLGNVEGAKAAGMHGVVFTSLLDVRRRLEEVLNA
jgi:HAD superfamily hydrolase (TIGR01509 family)